MIHYNRSKDIHTQHTIHHHMTGQQARKDAQNMKYFVVATRWSSEKQAQIKEIVGAFERFHMARIFQQAYNEEYSTQAEIVEAFQLFNN